MLGLIIWFPSLTVKPYNTPVWLLDFAEFLVFHRGLSFITAPGRPQHQAIRKQLHQHAF
jgi:hypothetical protein